MKKTGLFKILLFTMLGIVVATWIFSASYFNAGELTNLDMYNIGFFDFWQLVYGSFEFSYFLQILFLVLSVGALYGVLEKTGKYRAWIDRIVNARRGNELVFLIIVASLIAIITSVFDFGFLLFIFYPLIISIILAMGYDKITAFLATFGAQLIGTIGSTLGYNTAGSVSKVLGTEINSVIAVKIALLIVSLGVLIYFLSKAKRNSSKEANVDMFAGEKKSNKYSKRFIIITFVVLFVLLILGCTAWSETFKIDYFTNLKTKLDEWAVKLPYIHITINGIETGSNKVTLFAKIFGTVSEFGKWYYSEMSVMCIIAALLLGLKYRVHNIFDAMADGVKKVLAPGLIVVFAYTIVFFAGNTMFYPTIAKYILGITGKFNLFFSTIALGLASALHVDMIYVTNYAALQATQGASLQVANILTQGVFGVTMFITPTSAILVLGLSYLGIPYKEWVKSSWKLVLCLLAVVEIACIICSLVY